MRNRFAYGLCGCLAALLPVAGSAELSQKVRAEIVAPLHPQYTPPPPEPPKTLDTPAPLSDDPIVNLPKYHVEDKKVPSNEPDSWLGPAELQKKQLREYKKSMTTLGWILNSWYIPLLGSPPGARAKAQYEDNLIRDEFQRLNDIADAVAKVDPVEAQKLRASLDPSKLPKD